MKTLLLNYIIGEETPFLNLQGMKDEQFLLAT